MFTDDGEMRSATGKSVLKKHLKVDASSRPTSEGSMVIDGTAVLWVVHWPTNGTVGNYVMNFKQYLIQKVKKEDVYLVFDRYYDYSTKSVTRSSRSASRIHHQLSMTTELPPQKVILTVTENKKQLIEIICNELKGDICFHREIQGHKLIITSQEETPIEIRNGEILTRYDMTTSHEEADIIIAQQMLLAAKESPASITIISDDTDVFVLILHYYQTEGLSCAVLMESPVRDRAIVDIGMTVAKHIDIIPELLAAHALTGCDTVACFYGIGKTTVLKVLQSGLSLSLLGHVDASFSSVLKQATDFLIACYGLKSCSTMSQARLRAWATKTGKGYTSTPRLCSLPPTSEAFEQNVKRAHYQTAVWLSIEDLPTLNVEEFGWKKDATNKTLLPTALPITVNSAPDSVLRLIRCGCESDSSCSSSRCGCRGSSLPCTIFCACYDVICYNTNHL
ncbi:MAG: hypothetical protein AAGK05_11175 [Pseudomonadota bacterium]